MEEKDAAQKPAENAPASSPPNAPPPSDQPPVTQSPKSEGKQPREKMSKSDLVMSAATIVIAAGTIVSAVAICLQWHEMVTGGADTTAIKIAAQKQADAAQKFADNAALINGGVADAVGKLNLQAGELAKNARQTSRLAAATEAANNNTVQADRPWLGIVFVITDFEVGKKPTYTFQTINSGRRPAKIELMATRENWYPSFPSDPDAQYIFDTTPSTNILVPGQNATSIQAGDSELQQVFMDMAKAGQLTFFAFAKVEYRDLRTNQRHWSHFCVKYFPNYKTPTDNGFRNCPEYNETDDK